MPKRNEKGPLTGAKGHQDGRGRGEGKGQAPDKGAGKGKGGKKCPCE